MLRIEPEHWSCEVVPLMPAPHHLLYIRSLIYLTNCTNMKGCIMMTFWIAVYRANISDKEYTEQFYSCIAVQSKLLALGHLEGHCQVMNRTWGLSVSTSPQQSRLCLCVSVSLFGVSAPWTSARAEINPVLNCSRFGNIYYLHMDAVHQKLKRAQDMNAQTFIFSVVILVELLLFFFCAKHKRISHFLVLKLQCQVACIGFWSPFS